MDCVNWVRTTVILSWFRGGNNLIREKKNALQMAYSTRPCEKLGDKLLKTRRSGSVKVVFGWNYIFFSSIWFMKFHQSLIGDQSRRICSKLKRWQFLKQLRVWSSSLCQMNADPPPSLNPQWHCNLQTQLWVNDVYTI